jgi:hypothetical protein
MSSISQRQPLVPGLLAVSEDEDDARREQGKLDAYWILVALIVLTSSALVFFATR